jgi:hydrogenase nickel incorporation protein HypB
MCITCGCSSADPHHEKSHHHHHHVNASTVSHSHEEQGESRKVKVEADILGLNNRLADGNRQLFMERGVLALNMVSSPGSGKTTLLEKTLADLSGSCRCAVIEGDQQTDRDAEHIAATGVPVKQINTGAGCHLDAHMICHAMDEFDLGQLDLLVIENVGNLVCPASFDLGEAEKVVVLSVTEGEDKPLKYPQMFRAAGVMLLNKVDLLPHLDFDLEQCIAMARRVNPDITIFQVSARTGAGMDTWYGWLGERLAALKQGR